MLKLFPILLSAVVILFCEQVPGAPPCEASSADLGQSEKPARKAKPWPVPMPEIWVKHYEKRVEEFKAENATLPSERKNVVFVGDSITEGYPLERYFPGRPALNRGIISDGIGFDERGVLNRMDSSVFDCNAKAVFLLIGVNDLPHDWVTVEECLDGYREIVRQIRKRLPETQLVLQTLLPTGERYKKHAYLNPRIEQFNTALSTMAKEQSIPLIDLHALYRDEQGMLPADLTRDGLHLLPEAYAPWAEKAASFMKP